MVCAILGLLLVGQILPSPSFDPSLRWYTFETENFSVHFACPGLPDTESEMLARQVAATAEEVRSTLGATIGRVVPGRCDIVITDFHDYHNGWASPIPHNCITVIPTPPAAARTADDNWLRTLIVHEYSHLLQMSMASGPAGLLRRVFGKVVMPNALLPAWLTEGYAIWNETRFSQSGRLRSSEHDTYLRAAARSQVLLPIDRCNSYDLQRYPAGNAPYLYGSRFMASIAEQDSGIWDRYNLSHSTLLPFMEDFHARRTLKRRFAPLWQEWQQLATAHSESIARQLNPALTTRMQRLTFEGFDNGSPVWSRNGVEIYFQSRTGNEYPTIKRVAWNGAYVQTLHRGLVTGSMSLSPSGDRLAFAQYELVRNGGEQTDIYELNLNTQELKRLTFGLRARDPDFAPDTNLLVFVSNHKGSNALELLNLTTGEISRLAEPGFGTSYHTPRFSPNGRWVAVGVSQLGAYSDIQLIDNRTGWVLPITSDRANDLWPCWSRDGRFLFFVSDRTGIFNLYAYSFAENQLYRCTNVEFGIFEPAVGPGTRRIAALSHTAEGDDIYMFELSPAEWLPVSPESDTSLYSTYPEANDAGVTYFYNPFPSILPSFWLPWYERSGKSWHTGIFTLGWDVLQLHSYSCLAGYRSAVRSPFLRANYVFSRYRPHLLFSLDADRKQQLARLGAELPTYRTSYSQVWHWGCTAEHDSSIRTALSLGWVFSSARAYRFGVAPVEGRIVSAELSGKARVLAGANDLLKATACWSEYIGRPPRHWSLRLQLAAGTALGDTSARTAFSIVPGPTKLGVRGYTTNSTQSRHIVIGSVQFRTPLCWIERGIGVLPLFLRNINAAVFTDAGITFPTAKDGTLHYESRLGTGVELRLDLNLAHHVPVNMGVGAAVGLIPFFSHQIYFRLNSPLLAEILSGRGLRRALLPAEPW